METKAFKTVPSISIPIALVVALLSLIGRTITSGQSINEYTGASSTEILKKLIADTENQHN